MVETALIEIPSNSFTCTENVFCQDAPAKKWDGSESGVGCHVTRQAEQQYGVPCTTLNDSLELGSSENRTSAKYAERG